ncbi:hypothetical protein D3C87_1642030 [compost metagenome]
MRLEAGGAAEPEGARAADRQQVGQEVAGLVDQVDGQVLVLDAHVDVHAEDQVGAGHVLQVVDQHLVAVLVGDVLGLPVAEGVGARGHDLEAVLLGQAGDRRAQLHDVLGGLGDVGADVGADLDDRLVHLGLDALAEDHAPLFEHDRDVTAKLPRLGIDDLVLFLDPDGEFFKH